MSDLKPIGSEKLQGQEKIKRILEIARYKESPVSQDKTIATTEYNVNLADGNNYQIVKEKSGYIIKKSISEGESDYIEPMKNRKYYNSYSQAFKKLNLMAKEFNSLYDNEEGISLFGEQKKFVLKTPKPPVPEPEVDAVPPSPPPVPSLELPPSDISGSESPEPPMDGAEEEPTTPETETGGETPEDEEVSYKIIQKITGKLTQKIRNYDEIKGLTSEEIKYVINMVLSSLNLKNLKEEDKQDILDKFEEDELDGEMKDMGDKEPPMDTEPEVPSGDMEGGEVSTPEVGESSHMKAIEGIFRESKVDKVISKYFEVSDIEKKQLMESKVQKKKKIKFESEKRTKSIKKLSESLEQEMASLKFLEENSKYNFVGRTNKKNLVFEYKENQIKISPEGIIVK